MISKIALDKDTRKAVMAIVTKQAEIDWKDLAQYAGYGGAGGALLGGVSDYAMSDEKDPKKRLRNALHSAITTGLLGATGGAGAYSAQTLIPGMESPAVTLHGAPKVPDHPTTGSSENIANLASTGAVAATGSGALKDIKDWKANTKLQDTLKNELSGDGKVYHDVLTRGTAANASQDDINAAQSLHDKYVNEGAKGSHGAAVRNSLNTLKGSYTPEQLRYEATHTGPYIPQNMTATQKLHYDDMMKHYSGGFGNLTNDATRASRQSGPLRFMNWADDLSAAAAGRGHNLTSHVLGSSTLRRGLPTFGASIAANTIDSLLRNNGKVQN